MPTFKLFTNHPNALVDACSLCIVEDCYEFATAVGQFCRKHYNQQYYREHRKRASRKPYVFTGPPRTYAKRYCERHECDNEHHAKGLCRYHYQKERRQAEAFAKEWEAMSEKERQAILRD